MVELKARKPKAPERTDKKARLLSLLERGVTMIHLDARRPGVAVPEKFKTEPQLLLNLSYRFSPPDLEVTEWGVRETLTFGGIPYPVAVPWSALFALSSHVTKEFYLFSEDIPEELLGAPASDAPAGETAEGVELKEDAPPRPVLKEVEPVPGMEVAPPPPSGEESTPKRSHLRLVK